MNDLNDYLGRCFCRPVKSYLPRWWRVGCHLGLLEEKGTVLYEVRYRKLVVAAVVLLVSGVTGCSSPAGSPEQATPNVQTTVEGASGMPFDAIATNEMDALDGLFYDAQARCALRQGWTRLPV